ncbi:MAG: hypothetical protein EKK48_04290 [Candidatus Melainabacteria bacterium]|nr:MAG: hypothetical protein EKK48_04290 [Candidatus Melainabacteria bacterium]
MHKYSSIFIDDRDVRMLRIPHVTDSDFKQSVHFFQDRADSITLQLGSGALKDLPTEITEAWVSNLVGSGAVIICEIAGLEFRMYFHLSNEIRIFIEPCDYQTSESIENLLALLKRLALFLQKRILLTGNFEPSPAGDEPVLEFLPTEEVIYNPQFDNFVEAEIEHQKTLRYLADAFKNRSKDKDKHSLDTPTSSS